MKIWKIIKTALFLLAGIAAFIFRETFADHLKFVIGPLLILYGADTIVTHFPEERKFHLHHEFFYGAAQILLGSVIFFALEDGVTSEHYATICVIWAVWSILREANELEECVHKLVHGSYSVVLNMIESAVCIFLSITLILEPGRHHALIHVYLLCVELITAILFPYLEAFLDRRKALASSARSDEEKGEAETVQTADR